MATKKKKRSKPSRPAIQIHNPNKLETVPVDNLLEFQDDFKEEITEDDLAKLKLSIMNNGVFVPKFVWKNRGKIYLIDGHQTKKALLSLREDGYSVGPVPVVAIKAKTKEEAAEKLLLINSRFAAFNMKTDWFKGLKLDIDKIISEVEIPEFNVPDLDMGEFFKGVNLNEQIEARKKGPVKDTEPKIEKAAELQKKWKTKKNQLWILGDHRLLCGDATSKADVLRLMDGQKADMVFTDPPYGVAYVGKTKDALTIKSDDVSEEELIVLCKKWFDLVDFATRDGAYWLATVPAGPLHVVFLSDWKERGVLRQVMVWVKNSMVMGHSEYHYQHEPILFGWKKGERLKNTDRTKTTVWAFDRPTASREHPTMKPVPLWIYGIENHTKSGDLLYEPFAGSGTTYMACEHLDRRCFGLELDPKYVAVILERWHEATGKKPRLV